MTEKGDNKSDGLCGRCLQDSVKVEDGQQSSGTGNLRKRSTSVFSGHIALGLDHADCAMIEVIQFPYAGVTYIYIHQES